MVLRDKEKAKRRTEFARLFFSSVGPSIILLHSADCASFPKIPNLSFSVSNAVEFAPLPPIPVHQFLPLSQEATAIQSYIMAIKVYESNKKANIAAALRYEMAVQLQKTGDLGSATIYWEEAANILLLQKIRLPSRVLSVAPKIIVKDIKRKPSSRAPFTAYCALQRAMVSNIHTCM